MAARKGKAFKADYTADDVVGLYRTRSQEADETRIRDLASTFRTLCKLEHAVTIPREYQAITKAIRTPFVRDAHHRITAACLQKQPLVHIEPKDDKRREYRDAASVAERWDQAFLERQAKESGQDILWELTAALVRDGESVLKVAHKPDSWALYPERGREQSADNYRDDADLYKKSAALPIAWRPVDRLQTVFEDGEYGDAWCLEYGEYPKPYLRSKFGLVEDQDSGRLVTPKMVIGGRPWPEGELATNRGYSRKVEFWTDREWHVVVDGLAVPGWPRPNPYTPHLPLLRAKAPDSESMLYSLLFLVPGLDRLLTMKMNWAYLSAFPNPMLVPVSGAQPFSSGEGLGEGAQPAKVRWRPGMLLQPPEGYRYEFLAPPPTGAALDELIGIYRALIDVAGIPSVFRGVGSGDQAGYAIRQLMEAAFLALKVGVTSLQRQVERGLELTHWLVEHVVRQTVYVSGWDSINPKTGRPKERASRAWLGLSDSESGAGPNRAQVTLLGPVEVRFRPTLPTDEEARWMVANQLVNAPRQLMDRRHAIERFGQEEDPDAILDAIYVEQAIESDPTLKALVQGAALRQAGLAPEPPAPEQVPGGASLLVDPRGQPLGSGVPGVPGELAAGLPMVPGLNMPSQPPTPRPPGGVPGNPGGRTPGAYPGQPGGV